MAKSIFSRLMGGFRDIFGKKGKKQGLQQQQKPQPKSELQKQPLQSKPLSKPQIKKSSLDLLLDEIKTSQKQKIQQKEKPESVISKPVERKTTAAKISKRKRAISKTISKKAGKWKKARKAMRKQKGGLKPKKTKAEIATPEPAKPKKSMPVKEAVRKPEFPAAKNQVTVIGPTTKVELPKNVQESVKQFKKPSMESAQPQITSAQDQNLQQLYPQPLQQQPAQQDIDSEIETTRELMKRLETYYLKRKITDSEFRVKMLEYKEKLFLLNMKKNEIEKKGPQTQKEQPQSIIEHPHASASQSVSTILREKAKGNIDEGKLKSIEEKLELLMRKYNIPSEEIESKVEGMETAKLIDSFNKLISLLELEKKAEQELNKVYRIQTVTGFKESAKKVEEIKGIATELKKHRIITDFDRVLTLVDDEGRINTGNAAEQLAVPKKRIEECAEILEKDKLIELSYPPIGDAFMQIIDYKDRKKFFEKKKKEISDAKKKLGLIANAEKKSAEAGSPDAAGKPSPITKKKEESKEKGAENA